MLNYRQALRRSTLKKHVHVTHTLFFCRHPQTLIPLHINRWRRSHHYTNEFLNRNSTSFDTLQISTDFRKQRTDDIRTCCPKKI